MYSRKSRSSLIVRCNREIQRSFLLIDINNRRIVFPVFQYPLRPFKPYLVIYRIPKFAQFRRFSRRIRISLALNIRKISGNYLNIFKRESSTPQRFIICIRNFCFRRPRLRQSTPRQISGIYHRLFQHVIPLTVRNLITLSSYDTQRPLLRCIRFERSPSALRSFLYI